MKYEVIVIWNTGEKETNTYNSLEKAEEIEKGYKMAFGRQIAYTGIREVRR